MAKQKKKRTKKYSGADAKQVAPQVMRVSAEDRSPAKEWWIEHKQIVKIGGIGAAIVSGISVTVIGIISLF